jgi:uncharacterized membrane protein
VCTQECWNADGIFWAMLVLGTLAFGLYAVLIPHKLFKILVAAYRENRLWEDEDFLESHGWLVLKYKPKR